VGNGHLIIVGWQAGGGTGTANTITGITDNAGNAYVQAAGARAIDSNDGTFQDIWYAKNTFSGATSITVNPSAVIQGGAVIWEFSGLDTSAPLDQTAALNSQAATTAVSGAPVTTAAPNEVVISLALVLNSVPGIASGNAFTSDSSLMNNGWAHLVTSSPGTYQAHWNQNSAGTYEASTVSFKASSSALNACDLNFDGVVNVLDVNRAVNMTLGLSPCTANINGPAACSVVTVQRVVNASLPRGACVVDSATVTPTGLSCSPSSANAPGTSACTGTLSGAAPSGSLTLTLSSNNANATVPGGVTAASGATTFAFTATAGSITTNQTAVLTVSANGVSQAFSLNLVAPASPAQLSAVSCLPGTLIVAQVSVCTVTLTKATTGTATVSLSSSVAGLTLPGTMTIAAGSSSGTFTAVAAFVTSNQTATVTATWNGISKITPVVLSLTVSHSVTLSWVASTSSNIAGYNIYRGTISGGPYATKLNSSLIGGLSFTDSMVQSGQTYYYVGTAVDNSGNESGYSTQAVAAIPVP